LDDFYKLGKALENHGCTVNLREPDADDPLGVGDPDP
jgi:hypothetical protein